jgi:CRP/FNR family transcriptional regulator, cyclic AMP receptor protein
METIESRIASHPICRGLSAAHLKLLAGFAMRTSFAQGEVIFREGDPANRFYLIESGRVRLETRRPGGSVPIQTIGAWEVLGWSWLVPPYVWQFDAVAEEPTRAIFFYGTRLREMCDEDPALGYELMKRMSEVILQRLQATRRQLVAATQGNC